MDEAYRNSDVEMITFKHGNYCAVLSPSHGQWYRGKIQKVLQKNLMEVFQLVVVSLRCSGQEYEIVNKQSVSKLSICNTIPCVYKWGRYLFKKIPCAKRRTC